MSEIHSTRNDMTSNTRPSVKILVSAIDEIALIGWMSVLAANAQPISPSSEIESDYFGGR
jgi:hypothetical protein